MNKFIDLYCLKYTIFIEMQIASRTECKNTGKQGKEQREPVNLLGKTLLYSIKENFFLLLKPLAFHIKKHYIYRNALKQED
ncbi:MAG: hypothetical protein KBA03_02215 [Anaerolineaceae bacterium]|nr:hypothetical protein [Anaerolineaceae bacterium]